MEIIPVKKLEAEIAFCKDIGKLKEFKDKAEALRVYFRKAKIGFEIANQYSELKIRAERRCGELIPFYIEHGGDRKSKSRSNHRTLKSLGINRNQSRYWQAVAELPEDLFEEHLAKTREAKIELTSAGVYRKAFEFQHDKKVDKAPIPGSDSIKTPIRIRTISGDFMDHIDDFNNVDAIITDPPYLKEYLHLYENLARFAAQVLKPGGSLLAMAGVQHLPAVLALMTPHLTYQWAICYYMPGALQRVRQRKVMCAWKPVLWFVKGKYKGKWVSDVCRSVAREKKHHQWQQSESGITELVEKFTQPGEMIIDPLFGSGTLGEVAIKLNRQFIGIEIDPKTLKTAEKRLERVGKKIVLPSYFPGKTPAEILDNWEKQGNNGGGPNEVEANPTHPPDEQKVVQEKPFEVNGDLFIPTDRQGKYTVILKSQRSYQSDEAANSIPDGKVDLNQNESKGSECLENNTISISNDQPDVYNVKLKERKANHPTGLATIVEPQNEPEKPMRGKGKSKKNPAKEKKEHVSGFDEWVDKTFSFCTGCENDCIYCWAKKDAIRRKQVLPGKWKEMIIRQHHVDQSHPNYGRVAFPSTHDILPFNIDAYLLVLRKLLDAGNEVLIVSKPRIDCIKTICEAAIDFKEKILFRFTIGALDDDILSFWEPNASPFLERMDSLQYAYGQGFRTSVSTEPMLQSDAIDGLVHKLLPLVNDAMWIGKMNYLGQLKKKADKTLKARIAEIEQGQTDERIWVIYNKYKDNPKIKWKDSIKKVVGLKMPPKPGMDV